MQKQTPIFVKVSVGFTISRTPPVVKRAKKVQDILCQQLHRGGSWHCARWLLLLSSYLCIVFWAVRSRENKFAMRHQCTTAEQRNGVGQTWGLIYFGSAPVVRGGRRGEEFGDLRAKRWRLEDSEEEGPGGIERKCQAAFLLFPRYYCKTRQSAFNFHLISINEKILSNYRAE